MLISASQQAVADAAKAFVGDAITPHAAAWERAASGVPEALLERMGALGYFAMLVPGELGGGALDTVSYVLVTEQFAAGDCGICNLMNVTNSPVAAAIRDHGSAAQAHSWLGALAQGELHACFMLSEAHAGSDAAAVAMRAERVGHGYRLSGSKSFVTAGDSAGFALLVARTDAAAGKRGLTTFVVPRAAWRVARLEDKLGHRNCDTAEVVFDGIEVSADTRLGAEGEGYRIALAYLNAGRVGVAAQAIGVAQAAFAAAAAYAGQRRSFGKAIIEHQAVGFRLAGMATRLSAARQLTLYAAARIDAGLDAVAEASMAKACATEMAESVCSEALQIHGGSGYLRDHPVEKYYRDARVLSIYEGTNDIQNLVIARAIAGGWSTR